MGLAQSHVVLPSAPHGRSRGRRPPGSPRGAIYYGLRGYGLCGAVQALQDLFHAGQAGVEGDLDQPPPDLVAAVLVIGQVEGRVGEQVGSSGVAGVRDRSHARGLEYVGDRPFGHYVHDPGLRDCQDAGSGEAGERGGDFLAGQRGEHRVDEPAGLLGRQTRSSSP